MSEHPIHANVNQRFFCIALLALFNVFFGIVPEGFPVPQASLLFAQETSKAETSKNEITARIDRMVREQSSVYSYYPHSVNETDESLLREKKYKYASIVSSIPPAIKAKGKGESSRYQRELLNFIEEFKEFGAMYAEFIPDKENLSMHVEGLRRVLSAVKATQGCEFANIALLNGISSGDLMKKVVLPNEKLSKGEKFGKDENTLVFISADDSFALLKGFDDVLSVASFTSTKQPLDNYRFTFDRAFLDNYDNILLVQPKDASADQVLDRFFAALCGSLEDGAKLDIAYLGHGTNRIGATLSKRLGLPLEKSLLDTSDFRPEEKGGNDYATSIKALFESAIRGGYAPRMIGLGCSSDFLQTCVNMKFPPEERDAIKVFGTPYATIGNYAIGFAKDSLELIFDVSVIKNNCGLTVELTDMNLNLEDAREVDSFMIDKPIGANMDILDRYFTDGISSGYLKKPSGVIMQYMILVYGTK